MLGLALDKVIQRHQVFLKQFLQRNAMADFMRVLVLSELGQGLQEALERHVRLVFVHLTED